MELKDIKQSIKNNLKWDTKKPPGIMGGQHCGIPLYPVILRSDELDLEITIGYYRSQLKNKELAITLFELALDDILLNNEIKQ